jgi:hypothetical protein
VNRVLFVIGIAIVAFAVVMLLTGEKWGGPQWAIAAAILGIGLITVSRKR